MNNRIDSLAAFDLSSITFEDIRWRYGTFVANSTGSGRDKKYTYRNGVATALGDIEVKVWCQLCELLIQRDNEQQLFACLLEWESEHNYASKTAKQLRLDALELHSARIFDCQEWVSFIPFNRRYRPDVLQEASLVTVITACCNLPGETTQAQIDRAWLGTIACPHCGRWSEFRILEVAP